MLCNLWKLLVQNYSLKDLIQTRGQKFLFFPDCPALTAELRHATLLEELVFWTVKYEFPERLVCLLLKLLPDTQYKEALTRSFVRHYSRVSMMLMKSHNSDKLSNRIVHVSVQLFSNEELGKDLEIKSESKKIRHFKKSKICSETSTIFS